MGIYRQNRSKALILNFILKLKDFIKTFKRNNFERYFTFKRNNFERYFTFSKTLVCDSNAFNKFISDDEAIDAINGFRALEYKYEFTK